MPREGCEWELDARVRVSERESRVRRVRVDRVTFKTERRRESSVHTRESSFKHLV